MASTHIPEAGKTFNAYRWYVLAVLIIVNMFSVADRLVFSILIQDIKSEFNLTDLQLGLLGGAAFSIIYVIAGFPAARLADRSVRKTIVAAAIGLWSAMTAVCGLAVGFWTLFSARVGVGVGEGCSGPASHSLIADYFPRRDLAKAMGFFTIGASLGTAGGLIAGGQLAEAFGWRYAFVVMGLPGLVIGLLAYLTVREPKRGQYAAKDATVEQQPLWDTTKQLLSNRVFMGLAIGAAVQILIGYALAFWMPAVMLRQFEISTGNVGLYLGIAFFLGGIPGPILGGYVTQSLIKRSERWRALVPGLVSLLCLLPLAASLTSDMLWSFLAWFTVAYCTFVSGQAGILSGFQAVIEPAQRGFAIALAMFFNNLVGQAFGLALIGGVSDWLMPGYGADALRLAVFAVCMASGLIAMLVFGWTALQIKRDNTSS
ncbi:MAG: MFS transporter [Pseudomonadota bacterium]